MRTGNPFPILLFAFALANPWCATEVFAQVQASPQSHELTSLGMTPGQIFHLDGYELTETFDGATGQRRDYIQAPGEDHPREFYHHGRGTAIALVSQCRIVFVEDGYTTKLTMLVAVDLPRMKQTEVASDVAQTYRHQTGANVGNFVTQKPLPYRQIAASSWFQPASLTSMPSRPERRLKKACAFPRSGMWLALAAEMYRLTSAATQDPEIGINRLYPAVFDILVLVYLQPGS
jgi:hypothetical protein